MKRRRRRRRKSQLLPHRARATAGFQAIGHGKVAGSGLGAPGLSRLIRMRFMFLADGFIGGTVMFGSLVTGDEPSLRCTSGGIPVLVFAESTQVPVYKMVNVDT